MQDLDNNSISFSSTDKAERKLVVGAPKPRSGRASLRPSTTNMSSLLEPPVRTSVTQKTSTFAVSKQAPSCDLLLDFETAQVSGNNCLCKIEKANMKLTLKIKSKRIQDFLSLIKGFYDNLTAAEKSCSAVLVKLGQRGYLSNESPIYTEAFDG